MAKNKDIAFEFAPAISPVFKLYLIKEFQRLKEEENNTEQIEWDAWYKNCKGCPNSYKLK